MLYGKKWWSRPDMQRPKRHCYLPLHTFSSISCTANFNKFIWKIRHIGEMSNLEVPENLIIYLLKWNSLSQSSITKYLLTWSQSRQQRKELLILGEQSLAREEIWYTCNLQWELCQGAHPCAEWPENDHRQR